MDYNLEVLTRKGFKGGKYDARGMRYVKLDRCQVGECTNDAQLIWFYEDDMYMGCHACEKISICKDCMVVISEREYRDNFNAKKDSHLLYDEYEEWDTKEEDMDKSDYAPDFDANNQYYEHGRIICTDCFGVVHYNNSKKEVA